MISVRVEEVKERARRRLEFKMTKADEEELQLYIISNAPAA